MSDALVAPLALGRGASTARIRGLDPAAPDTSSLLVSARGAPLFFEGVVGVFRTCFIGQSPPVEVELESRSDPVASVPLKREVVDHQWLSSDDLRGRLAVAFDVEPLEDGHCHPAEQVLRDNLCPAREAGTLRWIAALFGGSESPAFLASVLKSLGRLPAPGSAAWRLSLVRSALAHESAEVRDAAVQTVELWEDCEALDLLRAHSERVGWLQDYIRQVVEDLST